MRQGLGVPKITLNDDAVSVNSVRTNSSSGTHHLLTSDKSGSESLFKYDSASVNSSFDGSFQGDNLKLLEKDDLHVPIPDCFLHSCVLSDSNYTNFVKKKKIDKQCNRFGEVYRFVDEKTMITMVGNVIKLDTFDSWSNNPAQKAKKISDFIEEIKILARLRHERIAHLYGVYNSRVELVVFTEYLPKGSVQDKVIKRAIEEGLALKYFRQATEGLRYIHSRQITHGNMKASNLLITLSDDVKLTDFAVSYELSTDNFEENNGIIDSNYRIQILHAAPECIHHKGDKIKTPPSADIWALGCVLVTMLTQTPPHYNYLRGKSDQEVYKIIADNWLKSAEHRLSYSGECLIPLASENARQLLDFIMNDDQFLRPTAEELLDHETLEDNKRFDKKTFSFNPPKTMPKNNGTVRIEIENAEDRTPLIEPNEKKKSLNKSVTVIEAEKEPASSNPFSACFMFFGSRTFIFLLLMLKWAIMVFAAAFILALVSSLIFLSISIIYSVIKMSCQCELNEGFVVLIAIIFLPIIILLTTLCCNNACEKYHESMQNDKFKSSRFYVGEPDDDIVLCGIKVIHGEDAKSKISANKKQTDGAENEIANQNVNRMLDTIAHLA